MSRWAAWPQQESDQQLARFAERLSLCILRDLCQAVPGVNVERNGTPTQHSILEFAQLVVRMTRSREHATCLKEWLADVWELLEVPTQCRPSVSPRLTPKYDTASPSGKYYLAPFMCNQLPPQGNFNFRQLWDDYYSRIRKSGLNPENTPDRNC